MNPIRVAHLSDSHLLERKESELYGIHPAERLIEIAALLKAKKYDLVIFTGDIAESGKKESYQLLASILDDLDIPAILIPGNHDNEENLINIIPEKKDRWVSPKKLISFHDWHFLHINTNVPGRPYGEISDEMITRLQHTIEQAPENLCILMHHPLLPTQINYLDQYNVLNPEKFLTTTTNKADLVLCGHVHGDYKWSNGTTSFETTPSTSFQFEAPAPGNSIINHGIDKGGYHINNKAYGFKEFILWNRAYQSTTIWCHHEKTI